MIILSNDFYFRVQVLLNVNVQLDIMIMVTRKNVNHAIIHGKFMILFKYYTFSSHKAGDYNSCDA